MEIYRRKPRPKLPITVKCHGSEHLLVEFPYDEGYIKEVRDIPEARFVRTNEGNGFRIKRLMDNCKILKQKFPHIVFDQTVLDWGREEREKQEELIRIASEVDAVHMERFQEKLPGMAALLWDYQKNAVSYGAKTQHFLLADDPGLGKTMEVIGALEECGATDGPILVVCPKLSIEDVWLYELTRFNDYTVFIAPEGRRERERLIEEVEMALDMEEPFFLVVNPQMISFRRAHPGEGVYDPITDQWYMTQYPFLIETQWAAIVVDEAHKTGLCNPGSQTARAFQKITTEKRVGMTGTPAGGKPERLWGILHWLDPTKFDNRKRWCERWLKKETIYLPPDDEGNERTTSGYTGIKVGLEEQFYREHSPYILRRTKKDVNPERPEIQPIHRWAVMGSKQMEQYRRMDEESMLLVDRLQEKGIPITMGNMLQTYTYLTQFADSFCEMEYLGDEWKEHLQEMVPKYRTQPTTESCKLPVLEEILEENGILERGDSKIVIFSQFRRMCNVIDQWLKDVHGITPLLLTGSTNTRETRLRIKSDFQSTEPGSVRVAVVSTKAGGVSINLDTADTCVMFDETWDPDDQKQAVDRLDRMSRMHQVTAYWIRTKHTIEHDVFDANAAKRTINDVMLDKYRTRRT